MDRSSSPVVQPLLATDESEKTPQLAGYPDEKLQDQNKRPKRLADPGDVWTLESQDLPAWATERKTYYLIGSSIAAVLICGLLIYALCPSGYTPVRNKTQRERSHWTSFDDINAVFSFGDSWSSFDLKTCPYYTSLDEHNPSNPAYPGFTTTGGPNWIGFLTHEFNRSAMHLHDLAIGGSTISNHTVHAFYDHDLVLETEFMVGGGKAAASEEEDGSGHCVWMPWTFDPDKSLFTFLFGMNDINGCEEFNECDTYHPPIKEIFASFKRSITKLYQHGARNFLLLNAPPISSLALSDPPTIDNLTHAKARATKLFNKEHRRFAQHLRTNFPGATVFEVDVFTLMEKVYNSPEEVPYCSNYKNLTGVCERCAPAQYQPGDKVTTAMIETCGGLRPEEYLWSGNLHTTWPLHKAIAKSALDAMDAQTPVIEAGI